LHTKFILIDKKYVKCSVFCFTDIFQLSKLEALVKSCINGIFDEDFNIISNFLMVLQKVRQSVIASAAKQSPVIHAHDLPFSAMNCRSAP
jgi:hypothetical protein